MQNAFGESHSLCYNDNVFQCIVPDDATADSALHSTKKSKGILCLENKIVKDDRLMYSFSQSLICS